MFFSKPTLLLPCVFLKHRGTVEEMGGRTVEEMGGEDSRVGVGTLAALSCC